MSTHKIYIIEAYTKLQNVKCEMRHLFFFEKYETKLQIRDTIKIFHSYVKNVGGKLTEMMQIQNSLSIDVSNKKKENHLFVNVFIGCLYTVQSHNIR